MAIVNLQAILSADHPDIEVDTVIQLLESNNWDESVLISRSLKSFIGSSFCFLRIEVGLAAVEAPTDGSSL